MKAALKFSCVSAVLASTLSYSDADAYDLKPIIVQLQPSGSGAVQSMSIFNSHDQPIAIEVSAFKRLQQADGTDQLQPEDNDLIISPPQMVIPPKSSQSFKVRWVGPANPEKELAYRIVTKQLPIKFKTQSDGDRTVNVSVNYRYEAALYVAPADSKPNAVLKSARMVSDATSEPMLEVTIANNGTARAILDNPTLKLTGLNGVSVDLVGETAKPIADINILADSERTILMPWPAGLPKGGLSGDLQTNYKVFR